MCKVDSRGWLILHNVHTSKQAGPDTLTTAIALLPGGVDNAKIVLSPSLGLRSSTFRVISMELER